MLFFAFHLHDFSRNLDQTRARTKTTGRHNDITFTAAATALNTLRRLLARATDHYLRSATLTNLNR
jgi:hypothetical protein